MVTTGATGRTGVTVPSDDPEAERPPGPAHSCRNRSRSALVTWSLAAALGATQVTTSVAPLLPSGSGGMTHCHAPLMPMILPARAKSPVRGPALVHSPARSRRRVSPREVSDGVIDEVVASEEQAASATTSAPATPRSTAATTGCRGDRMAAKSSGFLDELVDFRTPVW